MLVSEIIEEVREATGRQDLAFNLRVLTRAVQLLANKGLIDPLIGYFDFSVSGSYFVALPRDVKTPLKININKQPSFGRARLYEFHINSEGTTDGEDRGLSWADRGYSPIQDETKLPGKLKYKTSSSADNGKTITVYGLDANGREQAEELTGHVSAPQEGSITFHKITRVLREATAAETFLWCNGTNICAQYYADETVPEYRVIKLSKATSHVRVMFRRQVYTIRTIDDFIPMHSEQAVIEACKAVRFFTTDEHEKGNAALAAAEVFLKEEQASREEHNAIAQGQEIQPAIDASIYMRDGIVVADVYDVAADIFGPVGRRKLFDYITTAIEVLSNRGQWDARLGIVDVFTADNLTETTYDTPQDGVGRGHGYYVLPRHAETPVAINYRCGQTIPRNRWFEFHMNGDGGISDFSACRTWDDCGEVCLMRPLPLDETQAPADRGPRPTYLVAVPDLAEDDDTEVRIYGFERDSNGKDVEVWRDGIKGWLCPCVKDAYNPGEGAPLWTAVERITKAESVGFIRLFAAVYTAEVELPDGDPTWEVVCDQLIAADADAVTCKHIDGAVPIEVGDTVRFYGKEYTVTEVDAVVTADPGYDFIYNLTFQETTIAEDSAQGGTTIEALTPAPDAGVVAAFWSGGEQYGMWYPDELEPRYRMIRLPHRTPRRIRLLYRKRTGKVTSLTEPIPLRSRLAIDRQMRAIKAGDTDPNMAALLEAQALRYLRDERINLGPSETGMLQFDPSTSPGFTGNVL